MCTTCMRIYSTFLYKLKRQAVNCSELLNILFARFKNPVSIEDGKDSFLQRLK